MTGHKYYMAARRYEISLRVEDINFSRESSLGI